jgi:hypothetical protein
LVSRNWQPVNNQKTKTKRKKSAFYETRKFSITFTTAGTLNSILKKLNPATPSHRIRWRFILHPYQHLFLPSRLVLQVADTNFIPLSHEFPARLIPAVCHNLKCTNYEASPCAVFCNFLFFLLRSTKYFSQRTVLKFLGSSRCNTNRTAPSRVRFDLHAANQTLDFTRLQSTDTARLYSTLLVSQHIRTPSALA